MSNSNPAPVQDVPVGTNGIRVDIDERPAFATSGWLMLFAGLLGLLIAGLFFLLGAGIGASGSGLGAVLVIGLSVILGVLSLFLLGSLQTLSPGETYVVQFFGRYIGTIRRDGFSWRVPLTNVTKVPVRVRNFETNALKVNDKNGSPVIISAVVVWQVADTAKSTFAVTDYENFIHTQAEAALRHVTSSYSYDDSGLDETAVTLRGNSNVITVELAHELAERITIAGLEVIEVRLSNLSYAPEIASAMLQRQQAQALIDARRQIVQGAVGMTAAAIKQLEEEVPGFVLTEERRAAITSNLLTVIVGSSQVQPVVNTGV